jgi:hypothetical protein
MDTKWNLMHLVFHSVGLIGGFVLITGALVGRTLPKWIRQAFALAGCSIVGWGIAGLILLLATNVSPGVTHFLTFIKPRFEGIG